MKLSNSNVGSATLDLCVNVVEHIFPVLSSVREGLEQDTVYKCERSSTDMMVSIVLVHVSGSHFWIVGVSLGVVDV